MQATLLYPPQTAQNAHISGFSSALEGYGPDAQLSLLRAGPPREAEGGSLLLDMRFCKDEAALLQAAQSEAAISRFCEAIRRECAARGAQSAILRLPSELQARIAEGYLRLSEPKAQLVGACTPGARSPFGRALLCPVADEGLEAQLSRFEQHNRGKGLLLLLEPRSLVFTLPDLQNRPERIPRETLEGLVGTNSSFFDRALHARYFLCFERATGRTRLYLYDDEQSFSACATLAKQHGIMRLLLPFAPLCALLGSKALAPFLQQHCQSVPSR